MTEMTPRQRWLAILNRQPTDRVPTDYWATAEVHARLKLDLACASDEELWRKLHIDATRTFGPRYRRPAPPDDTGPDLWGIRYKDVNYGTGTYREVAHHPLAHLETVEQIHRHPWPSPDDFDYAQLKDQLAGDDGLRIRRAGGYEPFLLYCYLRGMEQSYEDLLVNPDIADGILTHLFDFYYELNRRTYEAGMGKIDFTYIAEDLAGQTGPLFGLDLYRKFLLPRQKKMADLARSFGIHIFYHTDGAARDFIPDLIDTVGIEVLNPIQWRCPGMGREGLVRDFAGKIAFHGGIDNQQTLPFGSPDDVAREVEQCALIFRHARWICAPCHNLQAVTPTANIVALYETLWNIGKTPGTRPILTRQKIQRKESP